jgi:hypothetical protein
MLRSAPHRSSERPQRLFEADPAGEAASLAGALGSRSASCFAALADTR